MTTSIRIIVPVAALAAISYLATNLVLPATPTIARDLSVGITEVQKVISGFFIAAAVSQLAWGALVSRFGVALSAALGLLGMVLTSVLIACSSDPDTITVARLIQGASAGVMPVVAPTIIQALLPPSSRVRGLSLMGSLESLAPALGPVLGVGLLPIVGWRGLFLVLAVLILIGAVASFTAFRRASTAVAASAGSGSHGSYIGVLQNACFRGFTASHALSLGALLGFVSCAPYLLELSLNQQAHSFAIFQVIGVSCFIGGALSVGKLSDLLGQNTIAWTGAWAQALVFAVLLIASTSELLGLTLLLTAWAAFCFAMGLRGPVVMNAALASCPTDVPRATALLMTSVLAVGGLLSQAGAWLLAEIGPSALLAMLLLTLVASVLSLQLHPIQSAGNEAGQSPSMPV